MSCDEKFYEFLFFFFKVMIFYESATIEGSMILTPLSVVN
jgi:hypothetical protein